MRPIVYFLIVLVAFVSCNKIDIRQPNKSKCQMLRQNIQDEFELKNISNTIKLYKQYDKCIDDKEEFHTKLALLYKENNQKKLSSKQHRIVIKTINNNTSLNSTEKSISKAKLYLLMNENEKISKELNKINKVNLTKLQIEEIELLEIIANEGEFLGSNSNIEFKLFN